MLTSFLQQAEGLQTTSKDEITYDDYIRSDKFFEQWFSHATVFNPFERQISLGFFLTKYPLPLDNEGYQKLVSEKIAAYYHSSEASFESWIKYCLFICEIPLKYGALLSDDEKFRDAHLFYKYFGSLIEILNEYHTSENSSSIKWGAFLANFPLFFSGFKATTEIFKQKISEGLNDCNESAPLITVKLLFELITSTIVLCREMHLYEQTCNVLNYADALIAWFENNHVDQWVALYSEQYEKCKHEFKYCFLLGRYNCGFINQEMGSALAKLQTFSLRWYDNIYHPNKENIFFIQSPSHLLDTAKKINAIFVRTHLESDFSPWPLIQESIDNLIEFAKKEIITEEESKEIMALTIGWISFFKKYKKDKNIVYATFQEYWETTSRHFLKKYRAQLAPRSASSQILSLPYIKGVTSYIKNGEQILQIDKEVALEGFFKKWFNHATILHPFKRNLHLDLFLETCSPPMENQAFCNLVAEKIERYYESAAVTYTDCMKECLFAYHIISKYHLYIREDIWDETTRRFYANFKNIMTIINAYPHVKDDTKICWVSSYGNMYDIFNCFITLSEKLKENITKELTDSSIKKRKYYYLPYIKSMFYLYSSVITWYHKIGLINLANNAQEKFNASFLWFNENADAWEKLYDEKYISYKSEIEKEYTLYIRNLAMPITDIEKIIEKNTLELYELCSRWHKTTYTPTAIALGTSNNGLLEKINVLLDTFDRLDLTNMANPQTPLRQWTIIEKTIRVLNTFSTKQDLVLEEHDKISALNSKWIAFFKHKKENDPSNSHLNALLYECWKTIDNRLYKKYHFQFYSEVFSTKLVKTPEPVLEKKKKKKKKKKKPILSSQPRAKSKPSTNTSEATAIDQNIYQESDSSDEGLEQEEKFEYPREQELPRTTRTEANRRRRQAKREKALAAREKSKDESKKEATFFIPSSPTRFTPNDDAQIRAKTENSLEKQFKKLNLSENTIKSDRQRYKVAISDVIKNKILANIPQTIQKLITYFFEKNKRAYIVGGFLRDILSNQPYNDIDLIVEGTEETLKAWCPEIINDKYKDNLYHLPSVKNIDISLRPDGFDLKDDALCRGLTVNALFFGKDLLDPLKRAYKELKSNEPLTMIPDDPHPFFENDPKSILKFIYIKNKLARIFFSNISLEIESTKELLQTVNFNERIKLLKKIITAKGREDSFNDLITFKLLHLILPNVSLDIYAFIEKDANIRDFMQRTIRFGSYQSRLNCAILLTFPNVLMLTHSHGSFSHAVEENVSALLENMNIEKEEKETHHTILKKRYDAIFGDYCTPPSFTPIYRSASSSSSSSSSPPVLKLKHSKPY